MGVTEGRARNTAIPRNSLLPFASFEEISEGEANRCYVEWEHKMGPINRPFRSKHVGLIVGGRIVGAASWSQLITPTLGRDNCSIGRSNAVELSRLCAEGSQWCRAVLRLWRETCFLDGPKRYAISYSDNALHAGSLYRHDGWTAIGRSSSGTDARSGAKGRNKTIWMYERRSRTPATGGAPYPDVARAP